MAGEAPLLRIGVSLRALFDLETEHAVFEQEGIEAFLTSQQALEKAPMHRGVGFEVISRLLNLNKAGQRPLVEVVLLSRNGPEASLRAFAAIAEHGLEINVGSFTNGQPIAPLLEAWGIDLFLSRAGEDVLAANMLGIAAGQVAAMSPRLQRCGASDEIRIALDGDCVVFGDEADTIFAQQGLEPFLAHESFHALSPMADGPFANVLRKLAKLRDACRAAGHPERVRIALVTARRAPAHARIVNTLRTWQLKVDEIHFVGGGDKAPVLAAFGAHIFFDDREGNVRSASKLVASAQVLQPLVPFADDLPSAALRQS